jgi:VanZ family protein
VGGLRVPVFVVAVALMAVVVMIELGSLLLPHSPPTAQQVAQAQCQCSQPDPGLVASVQQSMQNQPPPRPGLGIPYMALVDGLLLFILGLMVASLVIPPRVQGRLQGIVTLIVTLLLILAAIVMVFFALGLLILMVSLLLSVPFGTIVYLVVFGFFDRAGAQVTLSLTMLLKVVFAVCLAIAHQSFLTDKGLLLLVGASFLCNLVVGFLQGFVPGFLVSITDAVAAIVVAIIGIILAILALFGSIVSIVKAIKPEG